MKPRRLPGPPASDDIFGAWVPIVALTASKTEPIEPQRIEATLLRVRRAYSDILSALEPSVASWRDLTDAVNFLQTLKELGWAQDPEDTIEASKAALYEAAQNMKAHGKLRLSGPSIVTLGDCVDQFGQLIPQLSAHSYWQVVAHTKKRIQKILRGAVNRGDVVVSL